MTAQRRRTPLEVLRDLTALRRYKRVIGAHRSMESIYQEYQVKSGHPGKFQRP